MRSPEGGGGGLVDMLTGGGTKVMRSPEGGGGGLVDMLAGGGTEGAEVIDDGLLRRGVLNDGGLSGATISAGELAVSRTFGPMLGSTDL